MSSDPSTRAEVSDAAGERRERLTTDRVLSGALELADAIGIEPFTIRKLAAHLDVKPMTIYHHVPNKEAIIDGIVDRVFAEVELPPHDLPWRAAIRERCLSMRDVLGRHPWATPLMESRTSPGPATMRHHDEVLGCLLRGGLSMASTADAYAVIDSYVYGFALQEASLPFDDGDDIGELAEAIISTLPAEEYPHLTRFTAEYVLQPGYSFSSSFTVGLDLLLEGIEAGT